MRRQELLYLTGIVLFCIFLLLIIISVTPKDNEEKHEIYNLVLKGSNTVVLENGMSYSEPGYIIYNDDKEQVQVKVEVENNINYDLPGNYEVIYSIDGKVVAKRDVVVKEEERKQNNVSDNYIFELNGDQNVNVLKGYEYIDPLFIAKKKNGTDVSSKVTVVGGIDSSKVAKYEIHYFLRDNNESLELVRNVYVVEQNAEFSLVGESTVELEYQEKYVEKGVVAKYNGQDYKSNVTTNGKVDPNNPGEYKIQYTFKTQDFVASLERTVIVKEKKKKIDFHLVGDEVVIIHEGETFEDPLFTAIDDDGKEYNDMVVIDSSVNPNKEGHYNITYTLEVDDFKMTLTRTVLVLRRIEIDFRLNGDNRIELEQGSMLIDPGYFAIGSDGINYNSRVKVEGNVDVNTIGTYVLKYVLSVYAEEKILTREVAVVKKKAIVGFKLLGDYTMNLKLNSKYVEPGYLANDTDNNNLNSYVTISGSVDTSKVGTYRIKYTINYEGYNKTLTRTVNVIGDNYTLSQNSKTSSVTITIKSNTNNFSYFMTPNSKKVTSEVLTYTVSKNGEYKFYMYDKNNKKIDTIRVTVNSIDNTKPTVTCTAYVNNRITTYVINAIDESGIDKYVHNGKTYQTSTFSVVNNGETDVVRVYDKAGNYTDATCTYQPISSSGKNVISSYDSSTLKYWTEKPGKYYTVTHIWVKDAYSQMNVEVNTNFGSLETTNTIMHNTIRKYGYTNKGMVAVNASGFIMSAGSNYENYVKEWKLSPTSPVIFVKGNVVRDFTKYTLPGTTPVYGLKKNGYLSYYSFGSGSNAVASNQKLLQQMKNDGIRNTMSFSPVLVNNYQVASNATSPNIRQALCQIDRNNFVIITNTNGTGNRGVGFNFRDLANYMVSLNCRTGYNLDGGGSTNFYYKKNDANISSIVQTSRKVADILYFVEQ